MPALRLGVVGDRSTEQKQKNQPPFRCPAAPGPGEGVALAELRVSLPDAEREKAPAVPMVALALRSSIFLRSISSCLVRAVSDG